MKLAPVVVVLIGLCSIGIAHSHKLSPKGTEEERRITDVRGSWLLGLERSVVLWGLDTFGEPVHEEETDRIYGCDGSVCDGTAMLKAPPAVLAGLRWNDDPPFRISSGEGQNTACKVTQTIRFQTQPHCWYQLFSDAERKSAGGRRFDAESNAALLYRTHFGDLQFLHAMASADGLEASEISRLIMGWAEFNWRIMLGDHRLETILSSIDNPTIMSRFDHSGWTVQDLYTLGTPGLRPHIRDVAFGSLLHMLQDTLAEGHVERATPLASRSCPLGDRRLPAPGLITEFHAYNHQDHGLHGEADSRGALQAHLQDSPGVVDIGRQLLTAYQEGRSWGEVEPYLQCVFSVADQARVSSPGAQFQRVED